MSTSTAAHRPIASAWSDHAEALADWALSRLVVRRDVYGAYRSDGGQYTAHEALTRDLLIAHFRGVRVIGAHTTSPDGLCLAVASDIDAHDEQADTEANWERSLAAARSLAELGLRPLILDSNGKGGYHVREFFKKPIPVAVAYWLCERVAGRLAADGHGAIETFPKQGGLTLASPYGNWLRLPGRHHKRDHWSRIYDPERSAWLDGAAAVNRLLKTAGDNPKAVLDAYRAEQSAGAEAEGKAARSQAGRRRGRNDKADEATVRDALRYLPASWRESYGGTRADTGWLGVGMALHDWDPARGLDLWHEFSKGAPTKYDPAALDAKWNTFTQGGGLTVGSIFKEAERRGWIPPWQGNGQTNGKVSSGLPPSNEQPTRAGPVPERPRILITPEEHEVIDQAVAALASDSNVYQRGNALVAVLRDVASKQLTIIRPPGSPRITPLPLPRLRELLTRWARWEKGRKSRDGVEEMIPSHPPEWAVAGIAARGTWPEIRPIEAIIETPILRPDGTILGRPGYDERTALLYEPGAHFPPIPAAPTHAEARRAAEILLRPVVDFPFASDDDRAAWLAGLLTPLARFAITGPCPLFLIDANTSGSGKSKLTDIVAIISTGRPMPRTAYPDSDDEMRKRITSIALAADRLMLLDNIATTFGGSALDSALTTTTWRDRILGRSEMTTELPLLTVWYATGNNVGLRGDVVRRIVSCRLESPLERPEERMDFTIEGDLLAHVTRERPRLVAAALTLLRAHAAAGFPDGGLTPLGSFEAWSRVVRSAVFWVIGRDPCRTRERLRAADPEALARVALIEGWLELPDGRVGMTAAAALKLVGEERDRYAKLREVFMEWSRNDELPSARSIGMRLKAIRGRVISGKFFCSVEDRGTQAWRVEYAARLE